MPYDVVMPQLGMTMTEGSVLRWLKQAGDRVEKGEILFEVQTDKVNMEVESPARGLLSEILLAPETVVPVGTVIARISDSGVPAPENSSSRKLISPRARKVAAELGVDPAEVESLEGKSRIVEADVRRHFEQRGSQAPKPEPLPVSRKVIADRMTASVRTIPHFYLSVLADATALSKLRDDLLPAIERRTGARLSYTDLLIKALALALREHPGINVTWDGDRLVRRAEIHIAFAAQFGEKLMAPVVRDADRLALPDLARKRQELVETGRAGKLTLADCEAACSTLSNLGPFGVDQFQAIINPPQCTILAAGRIAPRPMVVDGQLAARLTLPLTLSVDHRVIDGVAAAELLRSIVRAVEAPCTLLLDQR